jgi:hypothetical protein
VSFPRPPILTIQVVPGGMDLILTGLRKLPHEQVDDLVRELYGQYKAEMDRAARAVLAEPAAIEATVSPYPDQPEEAA